MCLKYDEATQKPNLLKNNREFLFMQKILLNRAYCDYLVSIFPLKGFDHMKRIELYDDELYFFDDQSTISKVQMSSEPKRNFVLVQVDKTIFKYDLITKELLFRWKTTDNQEIILYDHDDKLCTVSSHEVRLWDFYDGEEKPPEIWATEIFDQKVEHVFINEGSRTDDKDKECQYDNWFIVVSFGNKFRVYKDRLEFTYVEIELEDEHVTAACFSETNDILFIGTSTGMIRFLNLPECLQITEPENFNPDEVIRQDPY